MTNLLVIDDEPDILVACLRHTFPELRDQIQAARTGEEGLEIARLRMPDVILLDLHLPDLSGFEVLARLQALDGRCLVVFLTASTTRETALEALNQGAFDYLFKPVDLDQLETVLVQAIALSRLMKVPVALAGEPSDDGSERLVGRCPALAKVNQAILRLACRDEPVLISGDPGTGKELVGRALYQHGRRSSRIFLPLSSSTGHSEVLEQELFGQERGTSSGDDHQIGKLKQARGGTIFLDEIGDCSLGLQAKLLRIIEDQSFEHVGGSETVRTDVCLLLATRHDLGNRVESGQFRADLLACLSPRILHLPPLRDRGGDLPLLVQHTLQRFSRQRGRPVVEAAPATLDLLRAYPWPGNVRELQSVLEQALLQCPTQTLLPSSLPSFLQRPDRSARMPIDLEGFIRDRLAAGSMNVRTEAMAELERLLFSLVGEHARGDSSEAARLLGIPRRTFRTRLRELGLGLSQSVEQKADEG